MLMDKIGACLVFKRTHEHLQQLTTNKLVSFQFHHLCQVFVVHFLNRDTFHSIPGVDVVWCCKSCGQVLTLECTNAVCKMCMSLYPGLSGASQFAMPVSNRDVPALYRSKWRDLHLLYIVLAPCASEWPHDLQYFLFLRLSKLSLSLEKMTHACWLPLITPVGHDY